MAKFKVGDKVKFKNLFKPERGEETGVVTGYDTNGLVLIRDDNGIKIQASEKLVRLAKALNACARNKAPEGWWKGKTIFAAFGWGKSVKGKVVSHKGGIIKLEDGTTFKETDAYDLYAINSCAACAKNAVVAKAMAMNASDPYLGEKLKLMIAHEAVSVSGGGKPSAGDVVFEYRGKKYYIGKDNAHMVKQFADAGLVKMVNSSDKVSANSVVAKALNAVRNAWADAPDAATAKRDIEQTVRKATEIAKRRYGAPKATYKMTPNDSLWCGYIDLTFNTEEEAKKCNPYYLFDELGDNKSILPKWSWAIGGFNYQKTGKVVRIFIGTLNT